MEKITYRKTLDVHKNGTQFTLQGFQTADKMSRVIEISLMASGDAIDFPLEGIQAVMYVSTPSAEKPSRIECDIKDNKIIYNVLPITEEGITIMQLKLIETSPGASVLYSPKFAVEVSKSDGDVNDAEDSEILTVFEKTIQKADDAYNKSITDFYLSSDGVITITYRDGSTYESDFLNRIKTRDNAALSESYAKGTSGVRRDEETDNAKYYSDIAKSESLNAKNIMAESRGVLDEVRVHGVYTAFSVNFETGEVEYVSPSFKFNINKESGDMEAKGQKYSFNEEIGRVVAEWLGERGVVLENLERISEGHEDRLDNLETDSEALKSNVNELNTNVFYLKSRITPIDHGGTGADNVKDALANLGITNPGACDYKLITTLETGEIILESDISNNYYEKHRMALTGFDATKYDELLFVVNGDIWIEESTTHESKSNDFYICVSSSSNGNEYLLYKLQQKHTSPEINDSIENCFERFVRIHSIEKTYDYTGNVSQSSEKLFYSPSHGETFELTEDEFYLIVAFQNRANASNLRAGGNLKVDVYGRELVF